MRSEPGKGDLSMTTRRDFLSRCLQGSSAVLVGTAVADLATARPRLFGKQTAGLPIVDTHQHLWDLSKVTPPWLGDAPEVLKRCREDEVDIAVLTPV